MYKIFHVKAYEQKHGPHFNEEYARKAVNKMENEDGTKIDGLGIFDVYAKRDMFHRHNSFLIGKYEDIEIIGFKSQFTMLYGNNTDMTFVEVEKGIGINKESKLEGIRRNNFFGTYLLGPILILNPLFTKKIIEKI